MEREASEAARKQSPEYIAAQEAKAARRSAVAPSRQALHEAPLTRALVIGGASISVGAGTAVCGGIGFIGAGTIVNKDIPPYSIAAGAPAKVLKRIDGAPAT